MTRLIRSIAWAAAATTLTAAALAAPSLASRANVVASTACTRNIAAHAVDGDTATRWCAEANTRSGWIELDLGRPVSISRALIHEAGDNVQRFQLQARVNNVWENVAFGGFIGNSRELRFNPVITRYVRLTICESAAAPSIAEISLFPR